jgi:hypothetical protein
LRHRRADPPALCPSDSPGSAAEGTWPLCGEAARGDESLHLTRDHRGWQLVRLTVAPGTTGDFWCSPAWSPGTGGP